MTTAKGNTSEVEPKTGTDGTKEVSVAFTIPQPTVLLTCGNTDCGHNKACDCILPKVQMHKTWAGAEDDYRMVCLSATNLPVRFKHLTSA